MVGGRLLVLAAIVVCIAASPAAAFKKCRTADGKLMFVDIPPPGCVVEEEFENRPAPATEGSPGEAPTGSSPEAATTAADAGAIAARRRIERELASAADDLVRLDRELAGAPKMVPGVYVDLEDGSGSVRDGTEVRPDVAADIAARRQVVEDRIRNLKETYDVLTRDLADRHGGVPSWWSESPRCDRCP